MSIHPRATEIEEIQHLSISEAAGIDKSSEAQIHTDTKKIGNRVDPTSNSG